MSKDILFEIRVRRICHEILNDKGKSKKVVMAEFRNRKSNRGLNINDNNSV